MLRNIVDKYNYAHALKNYPWLQLQYSMPSEALGTIEKQKKELSILKQQLQESKKRLEASLIALKGMRMLQFYLVVPTLKRQLRLLRLKKAFSLGKKRRKYKEKIREILYLIRDLKDKRKQ